MNAALAETAAYLDTLYGRCRAKHGWLIPVDASACKMSGPPVQLGCGKSLVKLARHIHDAGAAFLKVNPIDFSSLGRRIADSGKPAVGNTEEVKSIIGFFLDVDANKQGYASRDEALEALCAMPKRPTLIVNSDGQAGGFHAYWLLTNPHKIADSADRNGIRAAAKRWEQRLSDLLDGRLDATANIDRVLRPVGTRRKSGRLVTLHEYDTTRGYSPADLWIPPPPPKKPRPVLGPLPHAAETAAKYLGHMEPSVSGNNGSNRCYRAAAKMLCDFGLSADTTFDLLATEFNPRCVPPWSERELRHKIDSVLRNEGML